MHSREYWGTRRTFKSLKNETQIFHHQAAPVQTRGNYWQLSKCGETSWLIKMSLTETEVRSTTVKITHGQFSGRWDVKNSVLLSIWRIRPEETTGKDWKYSWFWEQLTWFYKDIFTFLQAIGLGEALIQVSKRFAGKDFFFEFFSWPNF